MARFGVLGAAEEEEIAELEAEEMAASLSGEATTAELHALIRLGEAAAANDPKLAALVLEITADPLAPSGRQCARLYGICRQPARRGRGAGR